MLSCISSCCVCGCITSNAKASEKLTNKVDPDTLNALDSRILREAFRQARKLQTKLSARLPGLSMQLAQTAFIRET
jgi:hypothetical protein